MQHFYRLNFCLRGITETFYFIHSPAPSTTNGSNSSLLLAAIGMLFSLDTLYVVFSSCVGGLSAALAGEASVYFGCVDAGESLCALS